MRSLQANRRYLERLNELWQGVGNQRELALARRATGLANNDTEDSYERMLAEPTLRRGSAATMEATLAFVTYLRRFASTVTSLASFPDQQQWKTSPEVQGRLKKILETLQQIELEVAGSSGPSITDAEIESQTKPEMARHNGERQLARLERQTGILLRSLEAMRRGGLLPAPAMQANLDQLEKSTAVGNNPAHR